MTARDVSPDRLSRAKGQVAALVSRSRGDRFGLVAFAGEPRVVVPLTEDVRSFAHLLEQTDTTSVLRGGSDPGAAIDAALGLLPERARAPAAIVLLSDGEDFAARGLDAARRAALRDVPVHAVGFGTALGSKIVVDGPAGPSFLADRSGREVVTQLEAEGLSALARASGGAYRDAGASDGVVLRLHEETVLPRGSRTAGAAGDLREDRYQWLLGAAFLLLLLDLFVGAWGRR
jgi:Ca-activated chloride channel family protein